VGNALISYVTYLGQMFWPSALAVLYPFTAGDFGVSKVGLSVVLLAGITAGGFVLRRRYPCFLTGWLWYLIMLTPVIGIVQVGAQARADRYTYLPQIGLYLMLTWAVADLSAGWRYRRVVLGGGAAVILAALILCARAQTAYWQNSETLWTHTLACTSDNLMAHNNLGSALLQKGKVDEAMVHFQTALQIKPDSAEGSYNLGNALLQKGKVDEAMVYYQKALQINPADSEACYHLGSALLQKGRVEEAIAHFQRALQIKPDSVDVLNNLAWLLATCPDAHVRDGVQAVQYAGRACELTHYGVTIFVGTLAAAYAEAGRYDDAVAAGEKACALATAAGERELFERNQKLLVMYRARQPYHEAAGKFVPAAP
jgi:tetratricopeptide (TPR) repeat protein